MTRGMSMPELRLLLECARPDPNLSIWDPTQKTAIRPPPGLILWPVEFLLPLHRKHVLRGRQAPDLKDVSLAIANWYNKERWKIHFRGSEASPWWHLKQKRRLVPHCPYAIPSREERDLQELTHRVWQACRVARGRAYPDRRGISNVSGIHSIALDLIKPGEIGVLPTDKDGGFALVRKDSLLAAQMDISGGQNYEEIPCFSDTAQEYFQDYREIVMEVGRLKNDMSFCNAVLSWAGGDSSRMVSKLKNTVKTHKSPGQVTLRPMHASVQNPMSGGMAYVSHALIPKLRSHVHIIKDSMD